MITDCGMLSTTVSILFLFFVWNVRVLRSKTPSTKSVFVAYSAVISGKDSFLFAPKIIPIKRK